MPTPNTTASLADINKITGLQSTAAQIDATVGRATATQAQAEAGTSTAVLNFTPQRLKQAITALSPSTGEAISGLVPLRHAEYSLTNTTASAQCPFDNLLYESVVNGHSLDASGGVIIGVAGTYRIDVNVGIQSTNPDIELRVNGGIVRTFSDGSISSREKPVLLVLNAGDVISVTTALATDSWYGGGNTPFATDTDYCRILITQMSLDSIVVPGALIATPLVKAKIACAAGQTVDKNTWIDCAFDTVVSDAVGFADLAGNKLIVPAGMDGEYIVNLNLDFDTGSSDVTYTAEIRLNGATIGRDRRFSTVVDGLSMNLSTDQLTLVAGDYISVSIYNASGFSRDRNAGLSVNWLAIRQVANNNIG